MSSIRIIGTGLLLGLCSQSWASGFAISGKSTSSLGHAFSGATVAAEDATVIYSNPALMQSLDGDQFSLALHSIIPGVEFENEGSDTNGFPTTGANSEVIDEVHFIPNLYYLKSLGDNARFGLGIYSPFGLSLEYEDNWVGRYHGTLSSLRTINISPAFSFSASDRLNLGVGVDFQYAEAELRNAIDYGTICAAYEYYGQIPAGTCGSPTYDLQPQQDDGTQTLEGSNWDIGYSMGLTYDFSQATRMGIAFHSSTRHDVKGTSEFDNVPGLFASTFSDTDAELTLMLPESLSIGVRHSLNPRLDLLADYTWTRWSRYDALVVDFDNDIPTSRSDYNWRDVPRYSVGMNYRWKEDWLIRAGASYEKTPIPDAEHRTPGVPDSNKLALGLGSKFGLSKTLDLDIAVLYTLHADADIDNTDNLGHTLKGSYEVETSYVSVQVNWKL